jgi:hypothetical protein
MVNRGSEWRRWEPHIHAPGTVLNNQFTGPDAWANYLTAMEGLTPKVEALLSQTITSPTRMKRCFDNTEQGVFPRFSSSSLISR